MNAPATEPRTELVERLFAGTGDSYDRVVAVATLGIDALWKRRILARVPPNPRRILDLACGTGILTISLARRFPGARVVGVDLREEYLQRARSKLDRQGLANVELHCGRAEDFRDPEPYDCITASYLPKYADLPRLAATCRELLTEGGALVMHDFTFPPHPALVSIWRAYFWLLRNLGSPLLPAWRTIFRDLPALIEHSRWIPELIQALQQQGFRAIEVENLTLHGSAIVSARKYEAL